MFVINNRNDLKEWILRDIAEGEKAAARTLKERGNRSMTYHRDAGIVVGLKQALMFIEEWEKQHPE